jgi:antitoxin component YwqK of YwqJK toxin-antitoxin module
LDGMMKTADRRGNLLQEIEYKDGKKHGVFRVYDAKGKVILNKRFEDGIEVPN